LVCWLREVEKLPDSKIVVELLKDMAGRPLDGKYPARLFVADPLDAAINAAWHGAVSAVAGGECLF